MTTLQIQKTCQMHLTAAKVIHFNSKGFVISPRTTRRLPKRTSSSKQLLWIFRSAYHKTLSKVCHTSVKLRMSKLMQCTTEINSHKGNPFWLKLGRDTHSSHPTFLPPVCHLWKSSKRQPNRGHTPWSRIISGKHSTVPNLVGSSAMLLGDATRVNHGQWKPFASRRSNASNIRLKW